MRLSIIYVFVIIGAVIIAPAAYAQRPESAGDPQFQALNPGSPAYEDRRSSKCDSPFRSLDGSCSNSARPWLASTNLPHFSYFRGLSSKVPTGSDRPSPRFISNIASIQDENIPNARRLNDLCVFFGQFIDHDLALTPLSDDDFPIEVPEDDPTLTNQSELEFFRSTRGPVGRRGRIQRPINSVSSVLDLSTVYGSTVERNRALRTLTDGKLLTSIGDFLPLNTGGLSNQPSLSPQFFVAGDIRCNEHPVLTTIHTIFLREHNLIVDELKADFPTWNDEELFQNARAVNIAQFQKIVYDEFIPAFTGRRLPRFRGFRKKVNPTVSNVFSTAAYRVGHTLVSNTITRKGPGNSPRPELPMADIFFMTSMDFSDAEEFVRGAANTVAQEVDVKVVDLLRNFLFSGEPGEEGFDLIALNLQRGRDHALPSYNKIRKRFRIPPATTFADITADVSIQERLSEAYGSVDDIDPWIGMTAETHVPGASLGKTMFKIWRAEFRRLRDGDEFFFLGSKGIPDEIRRVPRVVRLFRRKRGSLFRDVILRTTNVNASELPSSGKIFMA